MKKKKPTDFLAHYSSIPALQRRIFDIPDFQGAGF
jgi:hypothetical protein